MNKVLIKFFFIAFIINLLWLSASGPFFSSEEARDNYNLFLTKFKKINKRGF